RTVETTRQLSLFQWGLLVSLQAVLDSYSPFLAELLASGFLSKRAIKKGDMHASLFFTVQLVAPVLTYYSTYCFLQLMANQLNNRVQDKKTSVDSVDDNTISHCVCTSNTYLNICTVSEHFCCRNKHQQETSLCSLHL
uniref:Uncharacterized protein n=1 Tax=Oryza brachyantha TaxID=4533 RepID=J3MNP0_ORYBR